MTKPYTRKLPVIFRIAPKTFEVIAFFPTISSASNSWYQMASYAHVGQHSGASPEFYASCHKAKPEEFRDLLNELRSIYEADEINPVKLVVRSREIAQYRLERQKEWRASMAIESAHDL